MIVSQHKSIFRFWRRGMDTKTIADVLLLTEAEVANALPSILERARK